MTDERWQQLIEHAKKSFEDVSVWTEDLLVESSDGLIKQGTQDIIEFSSERGRFKVVRENRPVLLEKKMHFSHRQGASSRAEYKFSDTETAHKVFVFIEDQNGDWRKIEADASSLWG